MSTHLYTLMDNFVFGTKPSFIVYICIFLSTLCIMQPLVVKLCNNSIQDGLLKKCFKKIYNYITIH